MIIPIDGQGKCRETVTQVDLEELIYLRHQMEEAHERWIAKREEIRLAIAAGAHTEPGIHWAGLVLDERSRQRLVVR